jgi:cytochrome c553
MNRAASIIFAIVLISVVADAAQDPPVEQPKPAVPVVVPATPATTTPATTTPAAPPQPTDACVACHGPDGNTPTPLWPKIAGLSESYILKQLLEFQKGPQGDRNDPTMYGIVQNLSPQELDYFAKFYAAQKMTIGVVPQDKVALGQKIYRGGNLLSGVPACAACHDAAGQGNYLANFPRLSGQNSQYIVDQLTKYKSGVRKNIMMSDIAPRLTDEEIQAVASYVEGLH